MTYHIRAAVAADLEVILALLPRLADFALPPGRAANDLWRGDAELVRRWGQGDLPEYIVYVAASTAGDILGVAAAQLREELLSHAPSAHLELLAVRADAEGQGLGVALI